MATMIVKNAAGGDETIEKPLAPGRAAAADSRPVALSVEDFAALDGLEALITALNALLTTQAGYVDGLEAAIAATNSLLTTQATYVDGLEGLATTLNGLLTTQAGYLDGLEALLTTQAGYVDGLEGALTTLNAKDFATQATLAAVLAKIIAAPATEAKQDTQIARAVAQLGARTVAQSPAINVATDDPMIGAKVTSITALETGGSGIIGWLSQIWRDVVAISAAITEASATAFPAGENHFGAIGGNTSYIDVTLSLNTSAYAIGDLMADTQVVTNAMRINDGTGVLQSIQVLDEDDQGIAFDLVFLAANNTLGTENSAPSVSDANARDILGFVSVASVDYIDLGGSRIATKTNVGLICKPAAGTRNLYVGAITRGAPTYTASGVKLRLGFLQD